MNRKDISNISLKDEFQQLDKNLFQDFVAGFPPYMRGLDTLTVFPKIQNSNTQVELRYKYPTSEKDNYLLQRNVDTVKQVLQKKALGELSVIIPVDVDMFATIGLYNVAANELGYDNTQISGAFRVTKYSRDSIQDLLSILKQEKNRFSNFKRIIISCPDSDSESYSVEHSLTSALSLGEEIIKQALKNNYTIDEITKYLSFELSLGLNFFEEIAKIRVGRMLWAKIVKQYTPAKSDSMKFRVHANIYDSLQSKSDVQFKTMIAFFASVQTIEYNKDCFSNDKLNVDTERFFELVINKTHLKQPVDPWGGNDLLEKMTFDIAHKTWDMIEKNDHLQLEKKTLYHPQTNQKNSLILNDIMSDEVALKNNIGVSECLSAIQRSRKNNNTNAVFEFVLKAVKQRATFEEIIIALKS